MEICDRKVQFWKTNLKALSVAGAMNCGGTMHAEEEQSILQKVVIPKCSLAAFNQNV